MRTNSCYLDRLASANSWYRDDTSPYITAPYVSFPYDMFCMLFPDVFTSPYVSSLNEVPPTEFHQLWIVWAFSQA